MNEFLAVTVIIMLAAISPGPDFAVVVKNSVLHGRRAGMLTALGVSSSLLIHSAYCLFGLAIVISKSLLLFGIIKYLGAAYLIYIGIKSLFAKRDENTIAVKNIHETSNLMQDFLQGFLCNLLNPKAILFILAFFTLIISPDTSVMKQVIFSLEIALIHLVWFSFLSLVITHHRVRKNLTRIQHYITRAMGALLIGFGARIALMSR